MSVNQRASQTCDVTIVMITRERFSCSPDTLARLYERTPPGFRLIYVDGRSPRRIRRFLEEWSEEKGIDLVRTDSNGSPPQARNIGLARAQTKYTVFLDNDVIVDPGWLESLLACADETGAAAVGPLIGESWTFDHLVHYGGGDTGIRTEVIGNQTKKFLFKINPHNGKALQLARKELTRREVSLVELHCALFRTDVLQQVGGFDERVICEDHTELCIRLKERGERIFFEPKAVVTYVSGPVRRSDLWYYYLRWSDRWQMMAYDRLREKWGVEEDQFFTVRYARTAWFRTEHILKPLSRKLGGRKGEGIVFRVLCGLDARLQPFVPLPRIQQLADPTAAGDRPDIL
jgi:GT2 family glycosyltransferase